MKKLDLHVHTVSTISDHQFTFSLAKLKEYVQTLGIDGIAITNHNCFDLNQFKFIRSELSGICEVLPGIEINLGSDRFGHMICITSPDDIEDFASRCQIIQNKISCPTDKITYEELCQIFSNFGQYIWIPHYDKKPLIDPSILSVMKNYIDCGEVGSIRKFVYCQKDAGSPTPVYFSDIRPKDELLFFPPRQTYFDIDAITVGTIKQALRVKNHVSLSEQEGNSRFYVLPDLPISTGLNVIIGERSSGKTYTLNQIAASHENIKYIKQFSLIERDPEKAAEEFTDRIAKKRSSFSEEYFEPLKDAIDIVKSVSLQSDESKIESYVSKLIRFAQEQDRADLFAKCAFYRETRFTAKTFENLTNLIEATEKLLDAREYRDIIEAHIERESLVSLLKALILRYRTEKQKALKETWVNDVVESIKGSLQSRSAATTVPEVDFYECQMNRIKVRKFNQLCVSVRKEEAISSQTIENFTIQTKKKPFVSAAELKSTSGKRDVNFSEIMDVYASDPYRFLLGLMKMDAITESDYYKFFAAVEYRIMNRYGFDVSGGERAEFNLLQEISEAHQYDMLLIDEPESSFDNLFLRDRVNHIIRELATMMPVILVTHNSTVGASIKPDYIIYTKRQIDDQGVRYKRYFGLPSSKELVSCTGEAIKNFEVMLDCLEAGEITYKERKRSYDLLKD